MRTRVFKRTDDNWHPSYKLDGWYRGIERTLLVEVSLLPISNGKTRVCVWGGDDCGMERDFDTEAEAISIFMSVIALDTVNMEDLTLFGFGWC